MNKSQKMINGNMKYGYDRWTIFIIIIVLLIFTVGIFNENGYTYDINSIMNTNNIRSLQEHCYKSNNSKTINSTNPADLEILQNTKWGLISKGEKTLYPDTIIINYEIVELSNGEVALTCTDSFGNEGVVRYGDIIEEAGGGKGFNMIIYTSSYHKLYFFKIYNNGLLGIFIFYDIASKTYSDNIDMAGVKICPQINPCSQEKLNSKYIDGFSDAIEYCQNFPEQCDNAPQGRTKCSNLETIQLEKKERIKKNNKNILKSSKKRIKLKNADSSTPLYSTDPNDLEVLRNAKLGVTYKIESIFTDYFTFENDIITKPNNEVLLNCKDNKGNSGFVYYGNIMNDAGGGKGFILTIQTAIIDKFYFFKLYEEVVLGLLIVYVIETDQLSDNFSLSGMKFECTQECPSEILNSKYSEGFTKGKQYCSNFPDECFNSRMRVYVDCNNAQPGNGFSWETAYQTIGEAIIDRDINIDIWIKKGVYQLDETLVLNQNSKISLYGGFNDNETSINQRNYTNNQTVIDSNDQFLMLIDNYSEIILDGIIIKDFHYRKSDDNCVLHNNANARMILKNCLISHKKTSLKIPTIIHNDKDAILVIENSKFGPIENYFDMIVIKNESFATISNCFFKSIKRSTFHNFAKIEIINCEFSFTSNTLYNLSEASISNCTFHGYYNVITHKSAVPLSISNCNFIEFDHRIINNEPNSIINIQSSSFKNNTRPFLHATSALIHSGKDSLITFGSCYFLNNISIIYGDIGSNLKIEDCIIDNNGMGILNCEQSNISIVNCQFTNNMSYGDDIITINSKSSIDIKNCLFKNNDASMFSSNIIDINLNSNIDINNCRFKNNDTSSYSGIIGINSNSNIGIKNCLFENNDTDPSSNIIGINSNSNIDIKNCSFNLNSGDIILSVSDGDNVSISDSIFTSNNACINCESLSMTVLNSHFSNNNETPIFLSTNNGRIINSIFYMNNSTKSTGALKLVEGDYKITNCTFLKNNSLKNGVIYGLLAKVNVNNCILWNNSNAATNEYEIINSESEFLIDNSNIMGGYPGTNNINEDPLFMNAEKGDLQLNPMSPCIDTGNNQTVHHLINTDITGGRRIIDGNNDTSIIIDMGAYEFQTFSSLYDINGDNSITLEDVILTLMKLSGIKSNTKLFSTHQLSLKNVIIEMEQISQY
jgi:hypothetical protein